MLLVDVVVNVGIGAVPGARANCAVRLNVVDAAPT
jgi:hypothetical protein